MSRQFCTFIHFALSLFYLMCLCGCGSSPLTTSKPASLTSVALSTNSVAFGTVPLGEAGSKQAVTLSNDGDAALELSDIAITANSSSNFTETSTCPKVLMAGANCTILISFSASGSGSFSGQITISDNAVPSVQTISLTGTVPNVTMTVSPSVVTVKNGQAIQFNALLQNAPNNLVRWSLASPALGDISSSGLYTAPTKVGTSQSVIVTAVSQAVGSVSSTATITVTPSVDVAVSPAVATVASGQSTLFTADVSNVTDPSVIWSARLGSITEGGHYTAPSNTSSSALTDTITATSVQDPTRSAVASVTVPVTVPSGLVGWWPLDEGKGLVALDHSGQGNNGAWQGVPSVHGTYYSAGMIDAFAGYFDGSDNQVVIGTKPIYQFTGPFTVSAWVNTTYKGTILSMQDGGMNGYNLAIAYGGIRFCIYNVSEWCNGSGPYPSSSPAWTYFTGVWDGTYMSVYANGALVSSIPARAPFASTGPLTFGAAQRSGDYANFSGSIADVRIYNRALTASEILSQHNSDAGPPSAPTDLLAYPGNGQVGLTWDTPGQGAAVTNYIVDYRQTGTTTWTAFPHNPSVVNEQTVTGLVNGTSYDLRFADRLES